MNYCTKSTNQGVLTSTLCRCQHFLIKMFSLDLRLIMSSSDPMLTTYLYYTQLWQMVLYTSQRATRAFTSTLEPCSLHPTDCMAGMTGSCVFFLYCMHLKCSGDPCNSKAWTLATIIQYYQLNYQVPSTNVIVDYISVAIFMLEWCHQSCQVQLACILVPSHRSIENSKYKI